MSQVPIISESMSILMVMTDTLFLCLSAHWLALAILSLSLNLSVSDLIPSAILASFFALVRLKIFMVHKIIFYLIVPIYSLLDGEYLRFNNPNLCSRVFSSW